MAERRVASVLSQKTLAEAVTAAPPDVPPIETAPPPPADPPPRPKLYPPIAPSSVELHERQLRWLRERDRRAAALAHPAAQVEP
ncbi:MAG: hypothetical protein L3K02_03770 [Thermoplasmata archaeon]|nr:hypothetical protein [Thermoplasmata archaeon]